MTTRSDKDQALKARQNQKELLEKQKKRLQKAFDVATATPEGKFVLRHLMEICGYHSSSFMASSETGELLTLNTLYNEARRNVYLEIRKHIDPEVLYEVEIKGVKI